MKFDPDGFDAKMARTAAEQEARNLALIRKPPTLSLEAARQRAFLTPATKGDAVKRFDHMTTDSRENERGSVKLCPRISPA